MDNRGQAGETMTWVVATIIIFLMTAVFVLSTSLIATEKGVAFKPSKDVEFGGIDYTLEQMLFAILSQEYGEGTVLQMLQGSEPDEAFMVKMFNEFAEQGVECNFYYGFNNRAGGISIEHVKDPKARVIAGRASLSC